MKKRWLQIIIAVIVILVFVLSYVDFGGFRRVPQSGTFRNPTGPPQIEGQTGPPPEE